MERLGSEQKRVMLIVNRNRNVNQQQGEAKGKPEAVNMMRKGRRGLKSHSKAIGPYPDSAGESGKGYRWWEDLTRFANDAISQDQAKLCCGDK